MDRDSKVGGRALVLQWAEEGIIPGSRVDEALAVTGATPTAGEWRRFVNRMLLWSGASFLAISAHWLCWAPPSQSERYPSGRQASPPG